MEKEKFTSIIIPSWNQKEKCIACLKSIQKHTENYVLIFVDNASDKEEFEAIFEELKKMPHNLIRNDKNQGFVTAVNQGITEFLAMDSGSVILLNNDTEVTEGWVQKLSKAPFDIVGPITSPSISWQSCDNIAKFYKKVPKYTDSESYGSVLEKACDGEYTGAKDMVAFFCTLIRREVIEKVGLLSSDFGVGFGDDDDYCARAKKEGFKIGVALGCFVLHHHRSTFKKMYSEQVIQDMQKRNLEVFFQKKRDGEYLPTTLQTENRSNYVGNIHKLSSQEIEIILESNEEIIGNLFDIEAAMNSYMQTYSDSAIEDIFGKDVITTRRKLIKLASKHGFSLSIKEGAHFDTTISLKKI